VTSTSEVDPFLETGRAKPSREMVMLLAGVHPKIVSERLGHASVGITLDLYSHVLPTMQAEAVRAFDALFPASD
jgi:integrase